jgi:hypothetical protein
MKGKGKMKLTVKTAVTLFLTLVFGILVVFKIDIPSLFEEIYRLVVVFYFGTQFQKNEEKLKNLESEANQNGTSN